MGRTRRRAGLLLFLAVSAASLGACGGTGGGGAESITLYNGQHPQTTQALVDAFEKQSGVQVRIRSDDEDVLANQIVEEGGGSPADVIYTENSPALQFLAGKNLLAPASASTLAAVASRYDSPQGDWVGVSARVSVLVYNTSRLSPAQLPTSVMDLARPQWKGKLGLAPGETDFQPIVTSIALARGQPAALAWLKAVKDNAGSHLYPSNEGLTNAVNTGQIAIGIINHYYWYRQRAEVGARHSAVAYFAAGDPGYVVDVSGAAVLRSSRHPAAAQKFLAFLVSPAGQEIIARSQSYEYPLAGGVQTAQPIPAFSGLRPAPLTVAQLGDGSLALKLLQEAQLL
ncbi:MAG: iron ABC transporter substrate-binding protein [Acidimicrobiales bacterium]